MLTSSELEKGILDIAKRNLGPSTVSRVRVKNDADLDGKDSLRITIVLKAKNVKLLGDRLSKIKISIIDFLQANGDFRFPYTHYATEAELKALARHAS
ncbi:MAG: hypothetical protein WA138_05850 [Parvibaculum sp.]